MLNPRFALATLLAGVFIFSTGAVLAQNYPAKPIRIVTGEPSGNADINARIIAQGISGSLGQPVVIDNRPNGISTFEVVHKAPPDGYTLLVYNNTVWLSPLMQSVPYDPVRGFSPVTIATTSPNIFAVHPSLPVKSVKEFIALAKAKPGVLNFAGTEPGSTTQLAGELFKTLAHINIVGIPYKGTGMAIIDLIAGRVDMMIPSASSVMPHVKSGRLRALAVTSLEPSPLVPGLPTVAAAGLTGYEMVYRTGMFVPANTPAAIINPLNQEIVGYVRTPAAREKFLSVGLEAVGSSPQEFAARIEAEMTKMGQVIKAAGIKAN